MPNWLSTTLLALLIVGGSLFLAALLLLGVLSQIEAENVPRWLGVTQLLAIGVAFIGAGVFVLMHGV
jgi:hypothetical protein